MVGQHGLTNCKVVIKVHGASMLEVSNMTVELFFR